MRRTALLLLALAMVLLSPQRSVLHISVAASGFTDDEADAPPVLTWGWSADQPIETVDVVFLPFTCAGQGSCTVLSGALDKLDRPDGSILTTKKLTARDFQAGRNGTFVHAFSNPNPAIGHYRLTVMVVDTAGKVATGSSVAHIIERQPYVVPLAPGWNLVSLPARPVDSSLKAIFADYKSGEKMTTVLHVFSLQGGRWVSASFDPVSGTWDAGGGLTAVQDGFAYFVYSTAPVQIKFMTAAFNTLVVPAYRLREGWNGIGIVIGKATQVRARAYFASVEDTWVMVRAYASGKFSTAYNNDGNTVSGNWTPVVDGYPHVQAGRGYFVLLSQPDVMAP